MDSTSAVPPLEWTVGANGVSFPQDFEATSRTIRKRSSQWPTAFGFYAIAAGFHRMLPVAEYPMKPSGTSRISLSLFSSGRDEVLRIGRQQESFEGSSVSSCYLFLVRCAVSKCTEIFLPISLRSSTGGSAADILLQMPLLSATPFVFYPIARRPRQDRDDGSAAKQIRDSQKCSILNESSRDQFFNSERAPRPRRRRRRRRRHRVAFVGPMSRSCSSSCRCCSFRRSSPVGEYTQEAEAVEAFWHNCMRAHPFVYK